MGVDELRAVGKNTAYELVGTNERAEFFNSRRCRARREGSNPMRTGRENSLEPHPTQYDGGLGANDSIGRGNS